MEEIFHTQARPVIQPVNVADWAVLGAITAGTIIILLLLVASIKILISKKKPGKNKNDFGFGKTWNRKEPIFLTFKKPTPMMIPDKATYLKKSPSPTDNKSPPGLSCRELTTFEGNSRGKKEDIGFDLLDCSSYKEESCSSAIKSDNECSSNQNSHLDEEDSKRPRIFFATKYSYEKTALIITINKCTNLPASDVVNNTSDPYVKLQLLPEKQHKVKTRVVRRTLEPVYDEDFTFYGVHYNQLQILTLHFMVLSFDRYSRDDVVGEVMVELAGVDLSNTDILPLSMVKEITPRSNKLKQQRRGELLVSLCHQPASNRITVVVLKARNLPKMDITGLSDPYVKIYLLYRNQRIAKKKTHVKKRTLNPVFNESFVLDLPKIQDGTLADVTLELMMTDWDRVTKNEVIGRLKLGGEASEGSALQHWNEIQASPRRQIAVWHHLVE